METISETSSGSKGQFIQMKQFAQRSDYHPIYENQPPDLAYATTQASMLGTPDANPVRRRVNLASRVIDIWWLELLAVGLLVFTFFGMVGVLRRYQNQPIPDWPLGLSLNTALSGFGVVFKGPLGLVAAEGISQLKWRWFSTRRPLSDLTAFDDASRGPWGAVRLLWKARWRNLTAFLGALMIVVALGVDPFTQAVVSYYSCTVPTNNATTTISRTNSLFAHDRLGYTVPASARIAIDASFGDSTSLVPSHDCATHCRYQEPYYSIGLCSKCTDVTDQITTSCSSGLLGGCNYTLTDTYYDYELNTTARYTIYSKPARDVDPSTTALEWQVLAVNKYGYARNSSGILVSYGSNDTVASDSSTIDIVSASPVFGGRCSLYWCVRSYNATIESGVLMETVQSVASNWSSYTPTTPVLGTVRVDCLKPQVRSRLLDDGYISSNTEWMSWNGTYLNGAESQERISSSTDAAIPVSCAYQTQLLDEILSPDSGESFSNPVVGQLNATGPSNKSTIATDPESPSILLELYNNGSISVESVGRAFDNFTMVVSNYLRTMSSPVPRNLEPYLPDYVRETFVANPVQGQAADWNHAAVGEVLITTSCIKVRWPWLALPAALVLGAVIFFTILVLQTLEVHGHKVWKSSQEALVWHGLDGPAEAESVRLVSRYDMGQRARELEVQLTSTRRGWKLVQLDDSENHTLIRGQPSGEGNGVSGR